MSLAFWCANPELTCESRIGPWPRAVLPVFIANRTPGRIQIRIVASKEQASAGAVSVTRSSTQIAALEMSIANAVGTAGSGGVAS
jgi:hypothetical protein